VKKSIFSFFVLACFGVMGVGFVGTQNAEASYGIQARQYYSTWSYHSVHRYHYRQYFYKPVATATAYSYHYVISYPTQPRYFYFYNPVKKHYWGRYDIEAKGYSILAENDRKEKLEDIKECAFPKPGKMPNMPESKEKIEMDVPPNDLPATEKK
jgi:hypothetical protein